MRLIHHFDTIEQYEENRTMDYIEPWLSLTEENWGIHYNMDEEEAERRKEERLSTPLTFEIQSNGNIVWKAENTAYTKTIEYCKNGGEWTEITSTTGGTSISVVSGDTVQFRGTNATYTNYSFQHNFFSGTTCQFSVKGNIMSLLNKNIFSGETTFTSTNVFSLLFYGCTGLTNARKLLLPATTLVNNCYSDMFEGCISLTTAPELPATTLANDCYASMFSGCTSLQTGPSSIGTSATTMSLSACTNMFQGCTSLTTAPELPATSLGACCYGSMFFGCTSLTQAPELPATTLKDWCYWQMFWGCTSLTTAPELPATSLRVGCYANMFTNCTKLNNIKCLATNISANNCLYNWVSGVQTTSGTFVKAASMTGWTTGTSGIPTNWTVQDAS